MPQDLEQEGETHISKSSEVLSGTTIKATPPRTHPHLSRNAAATNTSQFNVYHKISPKPEDGAK
jgi:hypothetical protein